MESVLERMKREGTENKPDTDLAGQYNFFEDYEEYKMPHSEE